ncbi:hypothetical protein [Streptomyces sp. NPDC051286]|uniref:hypothetical protein n=1 Tax=Streptomyces sp. NPDC051286 TaxID=3365647 RepID=UPI00378E63B8
MDTASALREQQGPDFVVAPLPSVRGETLCRLGNCYGVSVLPYSDGVPGDFGQALAASQRGPVLDMLADSPHRRVGSPDIGSGGAGHAVGVMP